MNYDMSYVIAVPWVSRVTHGTADLASFPGLPCSSLCIQYNARKQNNSEKWGRPGLIHHVSGRKVDIGERARY